MPDVDGQIILGLDITKTTAQMNMDLNKVLSDIGKKEIVLNAKIGNLDFANSASKLKNIGNQINQEFRSVINTIDLVNGGMGNLGKALQGAGFNKSSIAAVTQDLEKMSLQVSKITTTMSKNGNIQLRIRGTDELNRAVTIVRQYDNETGKVVNSSKSFAQSFSDSARSANKFQSVIEKINQELSNNKIEASISGVSAKYEALSDSGHERLSKIGADLQTLKSLQQVMKYSQGTDELVASYTKYQEILDRTKNNLNIVENSVRNYAKTTSESKNSVDDFAKSLEKAQQAISNNSIEASIVRVNSQYENLASSGHEKLAAIANDLKSLESLKNNMSSSSSDKDLVRNYEQYEQVLSRVKNNLSIVSTETKRYSSETRKAAQEQNTLNRSIALSNRIEAWMNRNTKAAERYGQQLKVLQNSLNGNIDSSKLTSISSEFAKIQSEAKAAGLITSQFGQSIKKVGLEFLGLASVSAIISKISSLIHSGIQTVIDLDTALIDLKKTTTMSGSQLESFYRDANDAAKELGVTTKDIIQSASDWSRLGYSDKNSATEMSKLAAQFAAISPGVNIEESTTGLVSIMKAYGIEVEDVLDGIMSKINKIGNTAATSNSQIITGLQNSASAMAAMNSTLDENIAIFTAAQEIIQDESKVGNAIRSISMRVRGYSEDTGELSEELANITGEVYDLTKVTANSKGISLFTDETQQHYKSIYQYLKEISEVYDDLSEKQQQELMEKLFGKNRASVGQAILQNFEAAEKAMDNMANSAGSADAEMSIITESLEYKLNALKETGTGIFQNIFNKEDIGAAVDALTVLLNALDSITSLLGPGGTALIGGEIFAFIKNLD